MSPRIYATCPLGSNCCPPEHRVHGTQRLDLRSVKTTIHGWCATRTVASAVRQVHLARGESWLPPSPALCTALAGKVPELIKWVLPRRVCALSCGKGLEAQGGSVAVAADDTQQQFLHHECLTKSLRYGIF